MTPNDIFATLFDQCLIHSSSERLPLAADGNGGRDPQPVIVQRESLNGNSLSNSTPVEFRESGGRGHKKSMRAIMVGGHPENKGL